MQIFGDKAPYYAMIRVDRHDIDAHNEFFGWCSDRRLQARRAFDNLDPCIVALPTDTSVVEFILRWGDN